MEDNQIQQSEELEALSAIYGCEWKQEPDSSGCASYSMKINSEVKLYVTFTNEYPAISPPVYQLLAPTLNSQQKQEVHSSFQAIYE